MPPPLGGPGDADCFRSTKYVSKLVKDFLEEPLQETVTPKLFAYHRSMQTLLVEFFDSVVPKMRMLRVIFS